MTRVIRYEGRLRPAETQALARRLFWNQWFRGWVHGSGLLVVIAAGVLLLFAPRAVLLLAAAYAAWTLWGYGRLMAFGRRQANGPLGAPFSTVIDDAGFRSQSDAWRDERAWASFSGWDETADFFVLWEGAGSYRPIPKRLLAADGQPDALRALLREHLGAPLRLA